MKAPDRLNADTQAQADPAPDSARQMLPRHRVATGEEHSKSSPLSIHAMTVTYHRKPVLCDLDFDAPECKLIGILRRNAAA